MATKGSDNANWKTQLNASLHEKNCCTDVLAAIETKTGMKRLHFTVGMAVTLGLYLLFGAGSEFLCNLLGFIYPSYASLKSIECKDKDDDAKWLSYWVIYSSLSVLEYFHWVLLFWVPAYWLVKCVFLVYCMAPMPWNGSVVIYHAVFRPYILNCPARQDTADPPAQ